MHPLGVVVVLPKRTGTAVGAVVETAVDTPCWVGAGVTCRGRLPSRFCLGLCLAACTKGTMVFRLVRSGTNCTQLGFEGAHHSMVAIPPTPRADGDSNPLLGRKDSESNVAEHKAVALEAAEALSTSGIVNVKQHHAGVRLVGVSDQAEHGPLVQVDGALPFEGKEDILDLLWSDRDGLAVGVIS
jgi:hypothetical protein